MEDLYNKANKVPRNETDIKWNFTKFLVNREGNVVERFEPTYSISEIENKINSII